MGGDQISVIAGNLAQAYAKVEGLLSDVTLNAQGGVTLQATTRATANDAYALVQSGGDLLISGSSIDMKGGLALNAVASAITSNGGTLTLQATNALTLRGGNATSQLSNADIIAQAGGNISLSANTINLIGGTGAISSVNILTQKNQTPGNISITAIGDLNTSGASGVNIATDWIGQGTISLSSTIGNVSLTNTRIVTNGSAGTDNSVTISAANNLSFNNTFTRTAFGNMNLNASLGAINCNNSQALANAPGSLMATNGLQAFAGTNITFIGTNTVQVNNPTANALALFVVDQNNMGTGGFSFPIGSRISVNGGFADLGFLRIYTVDDSMNTIGTGALLNGLPYFPAGMADEHNVGNTTYPTLPPPPADGSQHYTIYYENPFP
jgi:hypothetical protein